MATQTLEFNAATGLTLSCKVFALNSDTVVDTQTATERTNDKNRYRVSFTDLPAGAYRLNAFVGSVGGFANEVFDVTLTTATFYPRSEDITLNGKIIGTLAAGTHTAQTGDAFARLGVPAGASIAADIANSDGGSGGGDATLAKQEEILAAIEGAQVIQVPSPNVLGNLVLTQGDTYDGIGNPKAQWVTTTDYTDGWAVAFTIRNDEDAVVYTETGEVASSTLVTVAIEAPTGLAMTGCPGSWKGKYDVQLSKNGSVKTIAIGACYINEDQTR